MTFGVCFLKMECSILCRSNIDSKNKTVSTPFSLKQSSLQQVRKEDILANRIPSSVIGTVASAIAEYYYSHSTLDALFMSAGAPGDVPEGNCEKKSMDWLKRCNDDPNTDALAVLGMVIQKIMDKEPSCYDRKLEPAQKQIHECLARNQLSYQMNGVINLAGSGITSKTLVDYFKAGDFSSIEAEFNRCISNVESDPHAAITASCSIIESLCKTYIETFQLAFPSKQTVMPLWKTVQQNIGLSIDPTLQEDQKKILQGLASIVDGIGAYRTHIGSAHGRGLTPPTIHPSEARLAINASHSLVTFIMERWQAAKPINNNFNTNF